MKDVGDLIVGIFLIIITILVLWGSYLADKGIIGKWLDDIIDKAIKETEKKKHKE